MLFYLIVIDLSFDVFGFKKVQERQRNEKKLRINLLRT